MPIEVTCPNCQKHGSVKDEWAGKKLTCPSCKQEFKIPPKPGHAVGWTIIDGIEANRLLAGTNLISKELRPMTSAAVLRGPHDSWRYWGLHGTVNCHECGKEAFLIMWFDASMMGYQLGVGDFCAPCPACNQNISFGSGFLDSDRPEQGIIITARGSSYRNNVVAEAPRLVVKAVLVLGEKKPGSPRVMLMPPA